MSKPEATRHLLVLDNHFAKYIDYFESRVWDIQIFESHTADDILLGLDLYNDFHAILLDFDWLIQLKDANLKSTLLDKIRKSNTPLIIIALLSTSDSYKKAMLLGASGFIPKEELDREQMLEEILSIIEHNPKSGAASPAPVSLTLPNQIITFYLRQPNICFRHWTDFFDKAAEDVFELDALNALVDCTLKELESILQVAIFTAHSAKSEKIGVNHFPRHKRHEMAILNELDQIEYYLALGFSWTEVSRRLNINDPKALIRQHRANYPGLVTKDRYKTIFELFELKVLVLYANAKKEEGKLLVETYLEVLQHEIKITITDLNRLTPNAVNNRPEIILDHAEEADAFIFLICTDFLKLDFIGSEVFRKAESRQSDDDRPLILSILADTCNLEFLIKSERHKILPGKDQPLSQFKEPELKTIFKGLNEAIKTELFRIWGY